MIAEETLGCLNCRNTNIGLQYYEFQNLLGHFYRAYFCFYCFTFFQKEFNKVPSAKQVEYHENIAKLIRGK
jgi:hypothetical protein